MSFFRYFVMYVFTEWFVSLFISYSLLLMALFLRVVFCFLMLFVFLSFCILLCRPFVRCWV